MFDSYQYLEYRNRQFIYRFWFFFGCISAIFLGTSCTQNLNNSSQSQAVVSDLNKKIGTQGKGIMQVGVENSPYPQTMNLDSVGSADIEFNISEGSGGKFLLILPVNSSVAKLVGKIGLGYEGCVQEENTMMYGFVHDFTLGDFICLVTDSGKIAEIKVERIDSLENLVELSYTVWE